MRLDFRGRLDAAYMRLMALLLAIALSCRARLKSAFAADREAKVDGTTIAQRERSARALEAEEPIRRRLRAQLITTQAVTSGRKAGLSFAILS